MGYLNSVVTLGLLLVLFLPEAAGDPPPARITSVTSLGLKSEDIPVSPLTKIVYLVNPVLNQPEELASLLRSSVLQVSREGQSPLGEDEITVLTARGRPGNTVAYDAVADVAEQFFKYMFTQVPDTDRSLHRVVQDEKRTEFPLVVFDAVPRLVADARGKNLRIETRLTVRLFMLHVEIDRDQGLRWVTRCELCYEDSSLGRARLQSGWDPAAVLAASVIDGLKDKIAASFVHAPALRRKSRRIEEPRRDLLGRSISDVFTDQPEVGTAISRTVEEGEKRS